MPHGFLDCRAPLRRARFYPLHSSFASQRQPVQFLHMRDPATLCNDAVLLLNVDLDVLVGRHSGLVLSGLRHDERGSVGNPASEHRAPKFAPTVLMNFIPRHQRDPGHFVVPASAHRCVVLRARNDVDGLALNYSAHELVRVVSLLTSMSIDKRRECRLNSLVVL